MPPTHSPEPETTASPKHRGVAHRHRVRRRFSDIFGSVAPGPVRRRATDAVRVVGAALLLAALAAIVDQTAIREAEIAGWVDAGPVGLSSLATVTAWGGTIGAAGITLGVTLASRKRTMALELILAIVVVVLVVAASRALLGVDGGREPGATTATMASTTNGFPSGICAIGFAAVLGVGPFLTRPLRRFLLWALVVGSFATVAAGSGLPLDVVTAAVLGWGAAAFARLAFGSPAGYPSVDQVQAGTEELGVDLEGVELAPSPAWGVARYRGREADGTEIGITVYGRDAASAEGISQLWRYVWYRDSSSVAPLTRRQQVEHEAFVTMLAERAEVAVPRVIAAGTVSTDDALLLVELPDATSLVALEVVGPEILDEAWRQLALLQAADIAHGALDGENVQVDSSGRVVLLDLREGTSSAEEEQLHQDAAELLVTTALAAGVDEAVASSVRVYGAARLADALPMLQSGAFSIRTRHALHHTEGAKALLTSLREQVAAAASVDVPQLAGLRRVNPAAVGIAVGTLFGFWLLVGQLASVGDVWSTIAQAEWAWVVLAFIVGQLTFVGLALALTGAVSSPLRFGPVVSLEFGLAFTGLVGGTVANTATIIRFFQRRGLAPSVAVSSGLMSSFVLFITQMTLSLLCLPFVWGDVSLPKRSSGGGVDTTELLYIVLVALILIGVVSGLLYARPRFRNLVTARVKPQLVAARENFGTIARNPRKLARLFGGQALSQILLALSLSAALHAYGTDVGIANLIVINTIASLIGGIAPVPGGMGVIEATVIGGLTSMGVPEDQAVAGTFTYRLVTAYLPPAWGWPNLAWLRRHEYL